MGSRTDVVAAGVRLARHGLIAGTEGNLSIRLDRGSLLMTPSGRRKDELGEDDLLEVTLDDDTATVPRGATPPSSDLAIHRAIYRARRDVRAVVHAHMPAAMALTLAGVLPDPVALPETALLLPRLPMVAFGAMGSHELAVRVATTFAAGDPRPTAVLLERHGAISVGSTIAEACDRMDLVDVLCRVWRDATLLAPGARFGPPGSSPEVSAGPARVRRAAGRSGSSRR